MSGARSYLLGLLGDGVSASLSPFLHEGEGRAQHLALVYRTIDFSSAGLSADDLPEVLRLAQAMGFDGLNVTHPFKERVTPLLDDLTEDARFLGAVNTVVFAGGRRIGANTDHIGFTASFRRELPGAAIGKVVQIGAGGAGAAVAFAMLSLGVGHLVLHDLAPGRAEALVERLSVRFPRQEVSATKDVAAALDGADGLVQTSPVGMASHPGLPIPPKVLTPRMWVVDIIYFPQETELLKHARQRGCRAINGGGMFVFQAAEAFRLFTGLQPNRGRILRVFEDSLFPPALAAADRMTPRSLPVVLEKSHDF